LAVVKTSQIGLKRIGFNFVSSETAPIICNCMLKLK
jgi:hypothetical protein